MYLPEVNWKSVLWSHSLAPESTTGAMAVGALTAPVPPVFYLLSGAVRSEGPGTREEGRVRKGIKSEHSLPAAHPGQGHPLSIFSRSILAASISSTVKQAYQCLPSKAFVKATELDCTSDP